jgi:choline-sulfatase
MPSRTALITGRFGIHNGVVGHGGTAADMFVEGKERGFSSEFGDTSFPTCLQKLGLKTVSITSFAERHSAWQWYSNFSEIYNPGGRGEELAPEVTDIAIDWIKRNGSKDNWFMHVNLWDPHIPYRTPKEFGNPFKDDPLPDWLSEEIRREHWKGCGSFSAQDGLGYGGSHPYNNPKFSLQPNVIDSMDEVRKMFDGYDTGIRYADEHIGKIIDLLKQLKIYDDITIIITADHGENLGELNVYYDHQTADYCTTRIPVIVKSPLLKKGFVDKSLHYHFDFTATLIELLGGTIPGNWDAVSFAESLKNHKEEGRKYLVIGQCAHTCQRAVRFDDYICIKSYHDGYHNFPDVMLFNIKDDPHELNNLADEKPDIINRAINFLEEWHSEMMRTSENKVDPLWTVIKEGGPLHVNYGIKEYIKKLYNTNRADCAAQLLRKYPELN